MITPHVSEIQTETATALVNAFADLMSSQLEMDGCETFTRDELNVSDLRRYLAKEILCADQALCDSTNDEASQTAVRQAMVTAAIALVRGAHCRGNL